MNTSYESAKRVALGLEREQAAQAGDDLWNISLDGGFGGFGIAAEMPFQFFEKGFDPPDEQTAQKAALMLYDTEYNADRQAAEERLAALKKMLAASDLPGLQRLLAEAPPVQWLSLIFLDGCVIRDTLVPLLEQADEPCRRAFSDAADQALLQLVDFQDLWETLKKHC